MPTLVGVAVLGIGCHGRERSVEQRPSDAQDLTHALAWLSGACLASPDSALPAGTPFTVVELGTEQVLSKTTVVGPATRDGACARLLTEGFVTVDDRPAALYDVTDWTTQLGSTGIAWTGPPTTISLVGGRATGDLDGDGVDETFTVCASSEGLHFAVFDGAPYSGKATWWGYLYLGYDVEADCPEGFLPGG